MMNAGMYSSATPEWATPQDFFDELNREFGFVVDVCATAGNAKCSTYFTAEDDGLTQDWARFGVCWMNPPYGRVIGAWVAKAAAEAARGATVVCLLPARTDTRWFHEHIYGKAEVRFIKGRLKFVGIEAISGAPDINPAPFPSMVVIFR
jgi:phage N-6-adenine-methyltransferase